MAQFSFKMEEFKHLDKKSLEIAAISASMAAVCQPCLKYHLDQAVKVGCTKDEINEAIRLICSAMGP